MHKENGQKRKWAKKIIEKRNEGKNIIKKRNGQKR